MHKGTEEILLDGFSVWRRNKKIAIPYVQSLLVQAALFCLCVLAFAFLFSRQASGLDLGSVAGDPSRMAQMFSAEFVVSIAVICAGFVLASALVSAYFDAGAIGMALKAVETGETNLDHMAEYGMRRFPGLFFARLLVTIATLIPFLLVGGALVALVLALGPSVMDTSGILENTVQFGIELGILVATVLSIIFAAAPYFIVIAGSGAVDGLEKSYKLLKENRIPYLILWVFGNYVGEYVTGLAVIIGGVVFALGILVVPMELHPADPLIFMRDAGQMLVSLLAVGIVAAGIAVLALAFIYTVIVFPLTTVWWAEFYLDRTKTRRYGQNG